MVSEGCGEHALGAFVLGDGGARVDGGRERGMGNLVVRDREGMVGLNVWTRSCCHVSLVLFSWWCRKGSVVAIVVLDCLQQEIIMPLSQEMLESTCQPSRLENSLFILLARACVHTIIDDPKPADIHSMRSPNLWSVHKTPQSWSSHTLNKRPLPPPYLPSPTHSTTRKPLEYS